MPARHVTAEEQTETLRYHIGELREALDSLIYKTFEVESAAQSLLSFEDADPQMLEAARKAKEARELLLRVQALFA